MFFYINYLFILISKHITFSILNYRLEKSHKMPLHNSVSKCILTSITCCHINDLGTELLALFLNNLLRLRNNIFVFTFAFACQSTVLKLLFFKIIFMTNKNKIILVKLHIKFVTPCVVLLKSHYYSHH